MSTLTKEIKNIIKDRKLEAESKAEKNLNNALLNQDVKKLYDECNGLKFEIAKAQFENKDAKKLIDNYNEKRKTLHEEIEKSGTSVKSLKPNYYCEKCNDSGEINNTPCSCYKKLLNEKLLESCGINHSLPSFEKLDYNVYNNETKDKVENIVKILQDIVNKIPNNTKTMCLMTGNVGVGKTYLAECLAEYAIKKDLFTIYTTSYNLNQEMLRYHLAPLNQKKEIIEKYINCEVLCIDDLGTENILKNVTIENLYLILNERLQNNKFTFITTNLSLQQIIDTYDERIFSRLIDKDKNVLINLEGDDLRLKR